MAQDLHSSNAEDPFALTHELGIPVLIADHPLHRRVSVHYLWLPSRPYPAIHRALPTVLREIAEAGFSALAVIADAAHRRIDYYRLDISPNLRRNPNG